MLEGAPEDAESIFGCGVCDMERSQCGAEACSGCCKQNIEALDTSDKCCRLRVVACPCLGAKENGDGLSQDHCEDAECEAGHGVRDLVGPC